MQCVSSLSQLCYRVMNGKVRLQRDSQLRSFYAKISGHLMQVGLCGYPVQCKCRVCAVHVGMPVVSSLLCCWSVRGNERTGGGRRKHTQSLTPSCHVLCAFPIRIAQNGDRSAPFLVADLLMSRKGRRRHQHTGIEVCRKP